MRIESIKKPHEFPAAISHASHTFHTSQVAHNNQDLQDSPIPEALTPAINATAGSISHNAPIHSSQISELRDALIAASDPAPDASVVSEGVLNPRVLFDVTKNLANMCQLSLGSSHSSASYRKYAVQLVDKVAHFETAFLAEAMKRQKQTGSPPSPGDMALIASDLFRELAHQAKTLAACTDDHEYVAEKLVELFTDLKRYHLANGSNAIYKESSERVFKRTNGRAHMPSNGASGTRFSSDISGNVKGGVGVDAWCAKLTILLGLSGGKSTDLLIDDDLDFNLIDSLYVGADLSVDAGASDVIDAHSTDVTGGSLSAILPKLSANAIAKVGVSAGNYFEGASGAGTIALKMIHSANGHKSSVRNSSNPLARAAFSGLGKVKDRLGQMGLGKVIAKDSREPYFLNDRKIYKGCGIEPRLQWHTRLLLKEAESDTRTFKLREAVWNSISTAYKSPEQYWQNDENPSAGDASTQVLSAPTMRTQSDAAKSMYRPLRTVSGSVAVSGTVSTGGGPVNQSASIGVAISAKRKTLPYEQSKATHQLLSVANCGSLEKSTAMIEKISRDLQCGTSAFFMPLVGRIMGEISDEELNDPALGLQFLKGRLDVLTEEYRAFVNLQGEYRATCRREVLSKINATVFDGHYDCSKHRSNKHQIDFEIDFFSRAADSYSFALGVIGNRISEATLRASEQVSARLKINPDDKQIDVLDRSSADAHAKYSKVAKMIEFPISGVPAGTRLRHSIVQAIGESVTEEVTGSVTGHVKLLNPKSELKPYDPAQIASIGAASARAEVALIRSKIVGHANPTRVGSFITLAIDVDAGCPLSSLSSVLVDAAFHKLVKNIGDDEGPTDSVEGKKAREAALSDALRTGLEKVIHSPDVLAIAPHLVGGVLRHRVLVKVRRPPAEEGFRGKWAHQYVRIERSKIAALKLNSPNAVSAVGHGAVVTAGVNSTQSSTGVIFEQVGEDLGYQVLQFKHGGAFNTKTQTPDMEKLKTFYESPAAVVTRHQLFSQPQTVHRMVSNYVKFLKARDSAGISSLKSSGTLHEFHRYELPGHHATLQLGKEAARINAGTAAPLIVEVGGNRALAVDPLDLEIPDLPSEKELEKLEKELASSKNMRATLDKYFSTGAGQKTMAAYMRIIGRYESYKAMIRSGEGYELVARPFGGKQPKYAAKAHIKAAKVAQDDLISSF